MRTQTYVLAGETCRINFPTSPEEAHEFLDWIAQGHRVVALDTETTGLNVYGAQFRVRLVQFGSRTEAWVLQADLFAEAIREAIRRLDRVVVHNLPFDALVLDRTGLATLPSTLAKTFDTKVLAHLNDPRGRQEGGTGLGLKDLSSVFVDASAPDTADGLNEVFRREYHATKNTGWALIDIDHPTYWLYAGLDVLLAARLFDVLGPLVRERGLTRLSTFEHEVQGVTTRMMRRGILLDVSYTRRLVDRLHAESDDWRAKARVFGVENVNSTTQVIDALLGMGEVLTERTDKGTSFKVDKEVLLTLADLDRDLERIGARDPNALAEAIFHAKRAAKWSKSYAEAMLEGRDPDDRIHPSIASLQARTARMSISGPPLQQLPSGDATIRRCLIADPGMAIGGVDYKAVEMRVLAALADEKVMQHAIATGVDLHDYTAGMVYGPDFSKAQRKLAKMVGFGKVYGGGAATLRRQTGAELGAVKEAIAAYDRVYPGIKRYSRRLQSRAEFGKKEVVTPSGRILPLDRDRLYSATNYVVQSTARDLLAQALVDLEEAGLGEHLLLPVHDEVIFQAPIADAEEVAREIARVMESDFFGVRIEADPEVYGPTWGHGYGHTDEGVAA